MRLDIMFVNGLTPNQAASLDSLVTQYSDPILFERLADGSVRFIFDSNTYEITKIVGKRGRINTYLKEKQPVKVQTPKPAEKTDSEDESIQGFSMWFECLGGIP